MLYTYESILARPQKDDVDQGIQDIQYSKLKITIEGDLQDLLGINIEIGQYGSIHLTQHHLSDQIWEDLKMGKTVKHKSTPASRYRLLSNTH